MDLIGKLQAHVQARSAKVACYYKYSVSVEFCDSRGHLRSYRDLTGFEAHRSIKHLADGNQYITFNFRPRRSSLIVSTYCLHISLQQTTAPTCEAYINTIVSDSTISIGTILDLIEDRSKTLVSHGRDVPFSLTEGYPDEVLMTLPDSDEASAEAFCERFDRSFSSYHDTLFKRMTPRFNLHMAFDAGLMEDLPIELREMIMSKINVGRLTYRPGQLQSYGLNAMAL